MADELVIVFENAPGPEPARFVEVENATTGESVAVAWAKWDNDPERWVLGSFVTWEDAVRLEKRLDDMVRAVQDAATLLDFEANLGDPNRANTLRDVVRQLTVALDRRQPPPSPGIE